MFLEETPEQQALRQELRAYYAELLTAEVRAGHRRGRRGRRAVAHRSSARIGKPTAGSASDGPRSSAARAGPPPTSSSSSTRPAGPSAPSPFVTVNTVGPTIMRYGTEEQKSFFLPGILAGEINFAIGYTEPEAGTDLASLRTRAVRDGDEYVVNGAKIFTSGADMADYIWLAVPDQPRRPQAQGHLDPLCPTDSPGFSWSPIVTVAGATTTATYYADVRVPVGHGWATENEGWRMITTQLNHERVGLAAWSGFASQLCDEVAPWAAATTTATTAPTMLDLPWVQTDLARCRAELEAMYLLNWRMATAVAGRDPQPGRLVGGQDLRRRAHHRHLPAPARASSGAAGYLAPGSPGAVLAGRLERTARHAQINTFGGGVNEIQREIVAMAGLGMTPGGPMSAVDRRADECRRRRAP